MTAGRNNEIAEITKLAIEAYKEFLASNGTLEKLTSQLDQLPLDQSKKKEEIRKKIETLDGDANTRIVNIQEFNRANSAEINGTKAYQDALLLIKKDMEEFTARVAQVTTLMLTPQEILDRANITCNDLHTQCDKILNALGTVAGNKHEALIATINNLKTQALQLSILVTNAKKEPNISLEDAIKIEENVKTLADKLPQSKQQADEAISKAPKASLLGEEDEKHLHDDPLLYDNPKAIESRMDKMKSGEFIIYPSTKNNFQIAYKDTQNNIITAHIEKTADNFYTIQNTDRKMEPFTLVEWRDALDPFESISALVEKVKKAEANKAEAIKSNALIITKASKFTTIDVPKIEIYKTHPTTSNTDKLAQKLSWNEDAFNAFNTTQETAVALKKEFKTLNRDVLTPADQATVTKAEADVQSILSADSLLMKTLNEKVKRTKDLKEFDDIFHKHSNADAQDISIIIEMLDKLDTANNHFEALRDEKGSISDESKEITIGIFTTVISNDDDDGDDEEELTVDDFLNRRAFIQRQTLALIKEKNPRLVEALENELREDSQANIIGKIRDALKEMSPEREIARLQNVFNAAKTEFEAAIAQEKTDLENTKKFRDGHIARLALLSNDVFKATKPELLKDDMKGEADRVDASIAKATAAEQKLRAIHGELIKKDPANTTKIDEILARRDKSKTGNETANREDLDKYISTLETIQARHTSLMTQLEQLDGLRATLAKTIETETAEMGSAQTARTTEAKTHDHAATDAANTNVETSIKATDSAIKLALDNIKTLSKDIENENTINPRIPAEALSTITQEFDQYKTEISALIAEQGKKRIQHTKEHDQIMQQRAQNAAIGDKALKNLNNQYNNLKVKIGEEAKKLNEAEAARAAEVKVLGALPLDKEALETVITATDTAYNDYVIANRASTEALRIVKDGLQAIQDNNVKMSGADQKLFDEIKEYHTFENSQLDPRVEKNTAAHQLTKANRDKYEKLNNALNKADTAVAALKSATEKEQTAISAATGKRKELVTAISKGEPEDTIQRLIKEVKGQTDLANAAIEQLKDTRQQFDTDEPLQKVKDIDPNVDFDNRDDNYKFYLKNVLSPEKFEAALSLETANQRVAEAHISAWETQQGQARKAAIEARAAEKTAIDAVITTRKSLADAISEKKDEAAFLTPLRQELLAYEKSLETFSKTAKDAEAKAKVALENVTKAIEDAKAAIQAAETSKVDKKDIDSLKNELSSIDVSKIKRESLLENAEAAIRKAQRVTLKEEAAILAVKDAKKTLQQAKSSNVKANIDKANETVLSTERSLQLWTSAAREAEGKAQAAIQAASTAGIQPSQIEGYKEYDDSKKKAVEKDKTDIDKQLLENFRKYHDLLKDMPPNEKKKFANNSRALALIEHFYKKYSPENTPEASKSVMMHLLRDKESINEAIKSAQYNIDSAKNDEDKAFWQIVLDMAEALKNRVENLSSHQVAVAAHAEEAKTVNNNDVKTELESLIAKVTGAAVQIDNNSSDSVIESGNKRIGLTTDLRKSDQSIIRASKVEKIPGGYTASVTSSNQGVTKTKIHMDANTKAYLSTLPNQGKIPADEVLKAAQDFVDAHMSDNRRSGITQRNPLILIISDMPDNIAQAIVLVALQKCGGNKDKLDVRHPTVSVEKISDKQQRQYKERMEKQGLPSLTNESKLINEVKEANVRDERYRNPGPG